MLSLPLLAYGYSPPSVIPRHLVRVGWGDMLFESMAFPSAGRDRGGRGFTGHLFAEYLYRLTRVVSVGAQLDFQGIYRPQMNDYDLTFLPTVRFTYLRTRLAQMYSGLGAGLLFAFDNQGGREFAPALNLNLAGARLVSLSLNYQF